MSEVTQNAFKGYGFQMEVAILFCFLMEFYPDSFDYLKCEIGDEVEHNFDDIILKSKTKSYFIQVKNYSSKTEKAFYEDGYIIYCDQKIKLSKTETNIFVCNSIYCDNENIKKDFYGLQASYIEEGNVYIIYLTPDQIESFKNDNCINDSRRRQLDSFFSSKLLNSERIVITDLPKFELYCNELTEQTIKVREFVKKPDENVLFIVAPPGYGKSHFANEIELPKKIIYRFWISQADNNYIDRLKYNHFLEQLSYLVDNGECRKKDLKSIVETLSLNGQTLILDGLDHVFTYNQLEASKYIEFIKECSKKDTINLIVLTRPLTNTFYKKYKVLSLQNWTKDECYSYCRYFKINKEGQDKIYNISSGYPIIVHYLCEEYLKKKGRLSIKGKIDGLNDYYKKILSVGNFDSNLNRLRLIASITPFLHLNDLKLLYDGFVANQLESLISDFPHLVLCNNKRVFFYHESVYQFILSNTNNCYFDEIHEKIFNLLLSGDVTFMSRISLSVFSKKQVKMLIKKYSNLDFFKSLFDKTFDFESIKVFYGKIMDELCAFESPPIDIFCIYNLVLILLLLSRNYYEDNKNLIFQLFSQLQKNNNEWGNYVFSSGALFNVFSEIESIALLEKEPTSIYILNDRDLSIEEMVEQENKYFNVLNFDCRKPTSNYLELNKAYPDSNVLAEYFVSGYIHETDSICKTIINEYESEYSNHYVAHKVLSSFSFIDYKTDTFPITFALSKALDRLRCLGVKTGIVEYDKISNFLLSHKDLNTFDMYNDLNGYIRYSNMIGRVLNLCEISPYLLMMDAHKDQTISYVPETMALYVKHGVFTLDECYRYLSKLYSLIDSGNKYAATNFINELGPEYVDELMSIGFFDTDSFFIFYSNLSKKILNKLPFNYVLNYAMDYYMRYPQSRTYVTNEELGNILKCKYMKKIRQILYVDGIEIKYTSYVKSQKHTFTKKQLERDWYFRDGCLELYKKYGFSIEQMARLYDGWGFKLFDPNIFSIFDDDAVRSNIERIIFIGLTEKKDIFYKYFQYNATLIYTIPMFYNLYCKDFNYKKAGKKFKDFLDIILRI